MKLCYNTDKLYLLEIMVNRLCIEYDKIGISPENMSKLKQVVVLCKFQDFPVLEIREEEFCKVREEYETQNEVIFKSGKSCLFSARTLAQNLDFFMINVQVAREKEDNQSSGLMVLGSTCVQLDCHFVEVLRSGGCQNSRSLEETYPLYSKQNCCIGNLSLCVRLSSLGSMILTSVKGGKGGEPFAVKGEGVTIEQGVMGDYSTYGRLLGGTDQPFPQQYPQYGQQQQMQPGMGPVNQGYGPQQNAAMGLVNQMYGPPQNANMGPVNQMGMPGQNVNMGQVNQMGMPGQNANMGQVNQMGMPGQNANMGQVNQMYGPGFGQGMQQPSAFQQSPPSQPDVPFCGHVPIRSSSSSSDEEPPPPPAQWPPDMFCSCDYPLPPGFEEPPRPQPKKKKKKKKDKNPCPLVLKGDYCMKPNCPMGFPLLPTLQKPEKKPCSQFPLPGGAIGLNNKQMMFQSHNLFQGPNAVTLEDEKNDIYILKIGSKDGSKKPKFILELKTPKIKVDEVKTQENDSQYRETDFFVPPPPKEKKGKKKGKKGKKDKKGKKGKKK